MTSLGRSCCFQDFVNYLSSQFVKYCCKIWLWTGFNFNLYSLDFTCLLPHQYTCLNMSHFFVNLSARTRVCQNEGRSHHPITFCWVTFLLHHLAFIQNRTRRYSSAIGTTCIGRDRTLLTDINVLDKSLALSYRPSKLKRHQCSENLTLKDIILV
jgi:hypothetical protein